MEDENKEVLKEILKALNGIWWILVIMLALMFWHIKPLVLG